MKVSDYIVEYLIKKGITDIFGYSGGAICHLIDSAGKYSRQITAHTNYHEQSAAFAACGYAQESGKIGVAFATSGPGATNLVTGIANAYFDSIPVLFLTGQVDTYALKGNLPIRQKGFQETDIVSITRSITKYAVRIDSPNDVKYELEKAYYIATHGNPGPVLLDLPADVQRADIQIDGWHGYDEPTINIDYKSAALTIIKHLKNADRPCLLIGNGVKQAGCVSKVRELINKLNIPTIFSMPAFDVLPYDNRYNYGFIGANGHRYGNFVLGKSDLIISIGSRLDLKQVGNVRNDFARQAQLIRIDIDNAAFFNAIHNNDINIQADLRILLGKLLEAEVELPTCSADWNTTCSQIKGFLEGYDDEDYTMLIRAFGDNIPDNTVMTFDVGQNEVWCAQEIRIKGHQSVHMSAGHGAMGYSLPAAIGCYYSRKCPVYSFNGDGGVQMNLQELQFLAREKIPVHVVVINNHALGMIRGFQEANFEKNYLLTTAETGYTAPDFSKLAEAYGLQYSFIASESDISRLAIDMESPSIIEIELPVHTLLIPNFGRNGLIQDQKPYLDRDLFEKLMKL